MIRCWRKCSRSLCSRSDLGNTIPGHLSEGSLSEGSFKSYDEVLNHDKNYVLGDGACVAAAQGAPTASPTGGPRARGMPAALF